MIALIILGMIPCTCSEAVGGGVSKQLLDAPALLESLPTELLYLLQGRVGDAVCLASPCLFCFSIPFRCTTVWESLTEGNDTILSLIQFHSEMQNFFCCYEINRQRNVLSSFLPWSSWLESVAGSFCPHQDTVIYVLKCMAGCSSLKLCIKQSCILRLWRWVFLKCLDSPCCQWEVVGDGENLQREFLFI